MLAFQNKLKVICGKIKRTKRTEPLDMSTENRRGVFRGKVGTHRSFTLEGLDGA